MQYLSYIYLIMLCSILPLYMKSGYYELGEAKADCYIAVSLCFFALISAVRGAAYLHGRKVDVGTGLKKDTLAGSDISLPRFFACGSVISALLSFVFSVDKKAAFFGVEGWRNGLLPMLLSVFFMVVFVGYSYDKKWTIMTALIVPGLEFVLGILDRMGIFLLPIDGRDSGYLATIGNINWYSGFLSIFVPLGMGLVYVAQDGDADLKWNQPDWLKVKINIFFIIGSIYTVLGLTALLMQGSDGAVLIVISATLLLLWIAFENWDSILRALVVVLLIGTAMTAVDLLMVFSGSHYNYDNNLLLSVCTAHVGVIIMAAAFFLYRLIVLLKEIKVEFNGRRIRLTFLAVTSAAVAAMIIALAMNFSDDFGNGRGIIWRMCFDVFMGLPDWQKLVGVGQDCLFPYAQSNAMWRMSFYNVFGNDILTNAHCELLTVMIERGFIGAVCYLGLFISMLYGLLKAAKKERAATIYALPVISYFVFSQISFAQVMSTPYVFLIMGLGMSLLKNSDTASR